MAGSFETSDQHGDQTLRPIRVPSLTSGIYSAAKEMVDDLDSWRLLEAKDDDLTLVCERDRGFVGGKAKITIRVEGPEGVPSSTVHVRSESTGGMLSKDKANIIEFNKPFHRRIC